MAELNEILLEARRNEPEYTKDSETLANAEAEAKTTTIYKRSGNGNEFVEDIVWMQESGNPCNLNNNY